VEVVVGPVSAASIGAWVDFARRLLHSAGPGADVPSDAAADFDRYLDEWEELSHATGDVTWATELEAELAEYLVYAFYRVAKDVNDEAGPATVVPDPAAPFYWLLVGALLDALAGEGGSRAEFASHLREFWPGEHEIP
jgi:hypothetical protein